MVPSQLNSRKRGLLIQGWHYTGNFTRHIQSIGKIQGVLGLSDDPFLAEHMFRVSETETAELGRKIQETSDVQMSTVELL